MIQIVHTRYANVVFFSARRRHIPALTHFRGFESRYRTLPRCLSVPRDPWSRLRLAAENIRIFRNISF